MAKRRILVAPLNWGLGHATRCIPIINELIDDGFEPIIASDGGALNLLKKEFPALKFHELPAYNIKYASSAFFFRIKLLFQTPHILRTISAEKKETAQIIKDHNIGGIISDSRWGVRNGKVPSVFINHQIKVLSGFTTGISSMIHKKYIRKFDECWVPDNAGNLNLSGMMSHFRNTGINLKYLGIFSRFEKQEIPVKYDIAVILSGPEPQRSILENIMNEELKNRDLKILSVRGVVENEQKCVEDKNTTNCNFLTSNQLEQALNQSALIICRPGYTSLMDLAVLQKKVFLIPTPGQFEQEYLFKKLQAEGLVAGCRQKDFRYYLLKEVKGKNLGIFNSGTRFDRIFSLFKSK